MENKQKKIDDLFQVIDERIASSRSELRECMRGARNAADNIAFSNYVRAKVKEILGAPSNEKEESINDCISIENACGRRAKSGDVVLHKDDHFVVTTRERRKHWQNAGYVPVGVYIVSSNGETGMLSLVNMSCETPETGDVKGDSEGRFLRYGGYGSHVDGLKSYKDEESYQKVIDRSFNEIGHGSYGYLPSDKFDADGAKAQVEGKRYYYNDDDNLLPPPFLADGVVNPLFGKGKSKPSFLSDADSRANTDALIKDATAQADWQKAQRIANERGKGYHPAACCCRRFHTPGTKAGDWDMPAIPVLACAFYDWEAVQGTLKDLAKDGLAVRLHESDRYWSSSERSESYAYSLYTYLGYVNYNGKGYDYLVRAFCRLPRI